MSEENLNSAEHLDDEDAAFAEFADALDAGEVVGDSAEELEDDQSEEDSEQDSGSAADDSADEAEREQQEQNIWDGLSDSQREALENLQRQTSELESERARLMHDVQSNRGRVSALSKKLEQLQTQQPEPTSQGRQESSQEQGGEGFDFDEFAEDFPEMATAMREYMRKELSAERNRVEQQFNNRLQQYDHALQPIQERHHQEYLQSQLGEVARVHPDYEQVTAQQDFWSWVGQQHDSVRALSDSESAQDNILLLNLYKSQNVAQQAPAQEQQSRRSDRARQLADMESLPSRGASRSAGVPDGEDAAFDHYARLIDAGKY